jgi:nucleoside-diphosphate-sugar epimerase
MGGTGKRVLVTGAGGFIGQQLVNQLAADGASVCATSRRLDNCTYRLSSQQAITWTTLDVTDRVEMARLLFEFQPEVVFNLAALVSAERSAANILAQAQVTLGGAVNLSAAAIQCNTPLIVHVGSAEEYGAGPVPFDEAQPTSAVSSYSAAKISATQFLLSAWRSFELPVMIVRPTVAYGPGQRKLLLPYLFESYMNNISPQLTAGEQTRDFVFIDDVVSALIACLDHRDLAGQIFNICSGQAYQVKDLAGKVANICGFKGELGLGKLPYRPLEVMRYVGNPAKALSQLGWKAKVQLDDGLQRTHKWWQKQLQS